MYLGFLFNLCNRRNLWMIFSDYSDLRAGVAI
jgi:hypothetical protein